MIESILKVVQGVLKLRGDTDDTLIGNSGDKLKVDGSGVTQPVSAASLPLPTGASTAANQATGNTSLASIDSKTLLTPFGIPAVAAVHNVFESQFSFNKQTLVWDETLVTGGTNTLNTNTGAVDMVATTTSGSSVVFQTRRRIRYNSSRSAVVKISANLGGLKANSRRRVGQFDTNNGVFFELDGTTPEVVVRSNTSGSIVDTAVAQSAWNVDKFDGTGASGLTVDFSKHQLYVIEYGWQGIAQVRFGFYLNGLTYYCHYVNSANVLTVAYMKTANLPVRLENTNTAATASNTTLSTTCVAVQNYGEDDDTEGQTRAFVRASLKTISSLPTYVPVLSVRLNSANLAAVVNIVKMPIYGQTTDDIAWKIILNTTLTGATFASTVGYVDIDSAATALSGGTDLDAGFVSVSGNTGSESADIFRIINNLLGVSLAGTSDVLTLAAVSRNSPADVWAAVTWREF